jgi:hypothetical protein
MRISGSKTLAHSATPARFHTFTLRILDVLTIVSAIRQVQCRPPPTTTDTMAPKKSSKASDNINAKLALTIKVRIHRRRTLSSRTF